MSLSLYRFLISIFLFNKIELNKHKNNLIKINRMKHEIKIISIEGNIGSGKSTLLENLKKHFNGIRRVIFLREPVDEWSNIKDEHGVTILEKFYSDQDKYSFSFQMMAYISRLKLLRDAINECRVETFRILQERDYTKPYNRDEKIRYYIITERSLFTDKMVFAKMLYDSGKIETVNYQIYLNWFNTFADEFKVNKVIYVNANPEICHERVGKRHRDGEDKIPLDYLSNCHKYHENMLDKSLPECVCDNQLILDGNIDIYENNSILSEWISSIEQFIYN
jgi:deoxyadenosine/deoxycytidine kinase